MNFDEITRKKHVNPASAKRITTIIIEHWNLVRGDNFIPSEQDLDADILESLLDNCFLIKATELRSSGHHDYVYIGQNIVSAYGSNVTHPKDSHDIDPLSHKNKFAEVIKTRTPVMDEGEFVNKDGHLVKYRQCLVPLGRDGRTVESIFGGMRFKVFD